MSRFYSLPKEIIDKWRGERKGEITDVCMDDKSIDEQLEAFRSFFETSFKGVGNPPGVPSVEEQFAKLYG